MKKAGLACVIATILASSATYAADSFKMGVVVKIGGIPWFNAMEEGIKKEAAKQELKPGRSVLPQQIQLYRFVPLKT